MQTRQMFRVFIDSKGSIYELRKVEMPSDTRSGDYVFIECASIALYLHTGTTVLACLSIAGRIGASLATQEMPKTGNVFNIIPPPKEA